MIGNKEIISLFGVASAQSLVEAALAIARDLTGSSYNVVSEIQVVHEYTMIP